VELYQAALAITAGGAVTFLLLTGHRLGSPAAVVGLAVAAALAERGRVKLSAHVEASISLLPTVFSAAVFGPLAAMLVAAASFTGDFPPLLARDRRVEVMNRGRPYLKWGIYTCIRTICGAVAGLAAAGAAGRSEGVSAIAVATIAASLVAEPLDVAFVGLTYRLRGGRARDSAKALVPVLAVSIPLYTPIVAILAVSYSEVSAWTLPLFFVPALAAQRLYALYQHQRELAEGLSEANIRLENANLSFASALVATLDARDRYTAGHSAAVAVYARDIAERMSLSEDQRQLAHLCGLVHDIGKIGLPAGLLEKPGALTLEERRVMETHSEIGERILSKVDDYAEIASIVRHHHERFDGQGYPDGLDGEDIPVLSRIIAVADAYNAMTSDRPYRDAMPSRVARLRLAQAVESQFDTTVVAAFEAVLAGATESYRHGQSADFHLEMQTHAEIEVPTVWSSAAGAA
jgi:putative nucleotidyltransferase with HDIG domain